MLCKSNGAPTSNTTTNIPQHHALEKNTHNYSKPHSFGRHLLSITTFKEPCSFIQVANILKLYLYDLRQIIYLSGWISLEWVKTKEEFCHWGCWFGRYILLYSKSSNLINIIYFVTHVWIELRLFDAMYNVNRMYLIMSFVVYWVQCKMYTSRHSKCWFC